MDIDRQYSQACHPDIWRVLGVALKPFCNGHKLLLERIGSPFVTHGVKATKDDLFIALLLCSQDAEGAALTLQSRVPLLWKLRVFYTVLFCSNRINAAMVMFQDYVLEALLFRPESWKVSGASRKSTAPGAGATKRVLMNHYGYSESQFLNMPIQKAEMEYSIWLEHERAIDFRTNEDNALIEDAKRLAIKLN